MFQTENLGEQALNKIAELALSSQLEASDSLEVKIDTAPEKLANGELESLLIEGTGLVIETDLRLRLCIATEKFWSVRKFSQTKIG